MRDAAIAAAHELDLFELLRVPTRVDELAFGGHRRLQRLLDALVAIGILAREQRRYVVVDVPTRPVVPRDGWGLLADVIRTDRPLALPTGELHARMHRHLFGTGAPSARALVPELGVSLLDIGGGAGAYTLALLAERPAARATLVDDAAVIALARETLAPVADRVRFIEGDARELVLGEEHDTALLANVLHLHGPITCERLCDVAARAVVPGGRVVIKDLRLDDDRRAPLAGVWFALNMAIYTDGGDVYPAAQLREWLVRAGLVDVTEQSLGDHVIVTGRRPDEDAIARQLDSALSRNGKLAWRELEATNRLRPEAHPMRLRFPSPLRRVLSRALAVTDDARVRMHYTDLMPRMRVTQIASTDEPAAALMHTQLDWAQLPRFSRALDALFATLDAAGIDCERPLGAESADALRAQTPTLAELYTRTHYGACMPLLYGYPADLTYFVARGADTHATIDRYLTAPFVHELCHLGRDREALPVHLDECVAGWLGVHVWPEFAYPAPGEDNAIYAAPWLAQIGQAIVRAFGVTPVLRGHSGAATWRDVLPATFIDAAARLCWNDWLSRQTLHFLSDTFAPRPWIALALAAGANISLAEHTLESLAALPLATLELRADDAFDRAIVEDALRAMCLRTMQTAGTFRTQSAVPDAPIDIDAHACRVSVRRTIAAVDPSYWLPPAVAARLLAHDIAGYSLRLGTLDAIPSAADAICSASRNCEREGFALLAR